MVKKISEYGGMEKYSSKKAMGRHEGKESSRAEAGEKSMAMKKRGGGMATRGMGVALKKGGKVMKKAMGGGVSSPIGRPNTAKPMPSNPMERGAISNFPTRANPTTPRQSNPMDRGAVSRMKKAMGGGVNTRNPPALGKLPIKPAIKVTSRARTPQEIFADKVNRGLIPPEGNKPNFPGNRGGGMKKGGMAKGRKGC